MSTSTYIRKHSASRHSLKNKQVTILLLSKSTHYNITVSIRQHHFTVSTQSFLITMLPGS